MNGAPARNDAELSLLEAMVDRAGALGVGIADKAEAEADLDRHLALVDAFNRSFQAVRLGIRLCMSLRAGRTAAPVANDDARSDAERPEREAMRDRPDRDYERDRDYEPVSLDRFLATLRGVTRDAQRLQVGDPVPLQRLLAEVDADKPAPRAHPAPPTRARFLNSAAPAVFKPAHPRESGDPGFFR